MSKLNPVECEHCKLFPICSPVKIGGQEYDFLSKLVDRELHYKRGDYIFKQNQTSKSIYALSSGAMKLTFRDNNDNEHIIDFRLAGELVAVDSIHTDHFLYSAQAIADCHICEISKEHLSGGIASQIHEVQNKIIYMLSREIFSNRTPSMMLLSRNSSEEKVAAFILSMASRYKDCGYHATRFTLPMTRVDIAEHLGLAKETVIRMFQQLQKLGLIGFKGKQIEIKDLNGLQTTVGMEI